MEQTFRWIFITIFVTCFSISMVYRRKARLSGEAILRRKEGGVAMLMRALIALPLILSFLAYMINPKWMAWSVLPLPVWTRWLEAASMKLNEFSSSELEN